MAPVSLSLQHSHFPSRVVCLVSTSVVKADYLISAVTRADELHRDLEGVPTPSAPVAQLRLRDTSPSAVTYQCGYIRLMFI